MNKRKIFFIFAIFYFSSNALQADFWSNLGDSISQTFNSFFSSDTLTSMGETFGVVPDSYVYSYAIWNDSSIPIYSTQSSQTSFMGGTFANADGNINSITINSWLSGSSGQTIDGSSDDDTYKPDISLWQNQVGTYTVTEQHMKFDLYISDESNPTTNPLYYEQVRTLSEENSTKVYHYRVYTARELSSGVVVHNPKVELLGWSGSSTSDNNDDSSDQPTVTISSRLTGINILNSTGDDVRVTCTYKSKPLTLTLEARSFNVVSVSGNSESLRPNTFSFYEDGSSSAFANVDFQQKGVDGYTYTMEVYQDAGDTSKSVGLQGLTTGRSDFPISASVRDITPINCTFWWESKDQYVSANSLDDTSAATLLDLPGQLWVAYQSSDSSILAQVSAGQAITWSILRPKLSEGPMYIYFLYVQTSDDTAAKNFVSEFLSGTIGSDIKSMYVSEASSIAQSVTPKMLSVLSSTSTSSSSGSSSLLTSQQETEAISGTLDYTFGSIIDSDGTVGYVVGADYFASYGLGSASQIYMFTPSVYNLSSLEDAFSAYLSNTISDTFAKDLPQWVSNYVQNPSSVKGFIEALLVQDGDDRYVTNGEINNAGAIVVQNLLTGPISIQNPSVDMSVVQNQYVYGLNSGSPDNMPVATTVTSEDFPS